jgi:hypothetical protein
MKFVSRMSGLASLITLAFLLVFLAGVPCKGRSQAFRQARLVKEFVEFFSLAIGQRVHRIDHDCARAWLLTGGARADSRVNDRDKEAKGLARTSAGRHREALTRGGFRDGLYLMSIKCNRFSIDAEDAGHVRMERPILGERLDRGTLLEMRVDRDQRFGPKATARVSSVDLVPDIFCADLGE